MDDRRVDDRVDDRSVGAPEPREDRASTPNGAREDRASTPIGVQLGRTIVLVDRRWADAPRAPDHLDPSLGSTDRGAHPVIARTTGDACGTTVRGLRVPVMAEAGVHPATDPRGATSDLARANSAAHVGSTAHIRSTGHGDPVGRTSCTSTDRARHSRRPSR